MLFLRNRQKPFYFAGFAVKKDVLEQCVQEQLYRLGGKQSGGCVLWQIVHIVEVGAVKIVQVAKDP